MTEKVKPAVDPGELTDLVNWLRYEAPRKYPSMPTRLSRWADEVEAASRASDARAGVPVDAETQRIEEAERRFWTDPQLQRERAEVKGKAGVPVDRSFDAGPQCTAPFGVCPDLAICNAEGPCAAAPSAPKAAPQEAGQGQAVAWGQDRFITDRDGRPIGTDDPCLEWGSEPPDDSGWWPLYASPAASPSAQTVRMLTEGEITDCYGHTPSDRFAIDLQRKCAEVWGLTIGTPPSAQPSATVAEVQEPRNVTLAEDRLLRAAVKRSSTLIAGGKLATPTGAAAGAAVQQWQPMATAPKDTP